MSEGPVFQDPHCSSLGFRGNALMGLSKAKKKQLQRGVLVGPQNDKYQLSV